jgi:hypothetical protein
VTDRLQIVALVVSAVMLLTAFELVRRRKLTEEYSFLWILSSFVLLALSARPGIFYTVARWLGVSDPMIVLIMLLIAIVVVASLCFSVIVSRQRQQIERLIEETAILSAELRELRAAQPRTEEHWERVPASAPYNSVPKRSAK